MASEGYLYSTGVACEWQVKDTCVALELHVNGK